jgi:hypothetical protein
LIITSCSQESILSEDSSSELLTKNHENNPGSNNLAGVNQYTTRSLPNGNGLQKINDNQTNEGLERGVGVSIPLFSNETVTVKTGTWVTLRFGLLDMLIEGSECPEEVSEEQVNFILDDVANYVAENEVSIFFDGEQIDLIPYFRTEGISTVFGTNSEGNTGCFYRIPWRYYVNPQAKGSYEFKFVIQGIEYTRMIAWKPGKSG